MGLFGPSALDKFKTEVTTATQSQSDGGAAVSDTELKNKIIPAWNKIGFFGKAEAGNWLRSNYPDLHEAIRYGAMSQNEGVAVGHNKPAGE